MTVHVISRKALRDFVTRHAEAEVPLDAWYHIAKRAQWENFAELRADFPAADKVGPLIVFDIGGNKGRLIANVKFSRGKVYVIEVLTHKDYDRGYWKQN